MVQRRRRIGSTLDGRRQHGAALHGDRRELEAAGWRTTLEYRENHARGRDGRLRELHVQWYAEAERESIRRGSGDDGAPVVIWATGSTVDKVWSRLRFQADLVDVGGQRTSSVADSMVLARPAGATL